jgi:hypothetical protein
MHVLKSSQGWITGTFQPSTTGRKIKRISLNGKLLAQLQDVPPIFYINPRVNGAHILVWFMPEPSLWFASFFFLTILGPFCVFMLAEKVSELCSGLNVGPLEVTRKFVRFLQTCTLKPESPRQLTLCKYNTAHLPSKDDAICFSEGSPRLPAPSALTRANVSMKSVLWTYTMVIPYD